MARFTRLCLRSSAERQRAGSTERSAGIEHTGHSIDAFEERASPLARYLLLAYALLTLYASLYPFSGWRDIGVGPFDFLREPPRLWLVFDIMANVLGYAPLGFLAVLALRPAVRGIAAFALATGAGFALSLGVEAVQSYLPARTPSNIDLYANVFGAMIGALAGAQFAAPLLRDGAMQRLRRRLFRPGGQIDMGLVLIGLWLLTQLNPETLLFGNGDLRELFQGPPGVHYGPSLFIRVEAFVAGANVTAAGLLLALLMPRGQPVRTLFIVLLVVALCVRSLAYGLFLKSPAMLLWLTPGAALGTAIGIVIVLLIARLPWRAQLALCGLALMSATVVVNIAPTNPYLAASYAHWSQGHFLNFNGLTRLLSAAWPFFTLVYVMSLGTGRGRRLW